MAHVFGIWFIFLLSLFGSVSGNISCSFDFGLCGWHSKDTVPRIQWRNISGPTPDFTSGALNDHTCQNYKGQYVFIPGSYFGPMESSVFESDMVEVNQASKLTFWYTMNGLGVGSLTLEIIEDNVTTVMWSKSGRQNKKWRQASVPVKQGNVTFQFTANVTLPYSSDVALDDIELQSESPVDYDKSHCTLPTTTSTPTTPTPQTTAPTTIVTRVKPTGSSTTVNNRPTCSKLPGNVTQLSGSCDFGKDSCGFVITANDTNRRVTWDRTSKPNGFDKTKIADHTFENDTKITGSYMLFQNGGYSLFGNPKLIASLETPLIYENYVCLTFWYNMPSTYSNLKVSVKDYTGQLRQIWKRDEAIHGSFSGWHVTSASILEDPPFSIVFQTYNNYYVAKVGVDDVLIMGTNVSGSSYTKTTPESTVAYKTPVITASITSSKTTVHPTSAKLMTMAEVSTTSPTTGGQKSEVPKNSSPPTTHIGSSKETTFVSSPIINNKTSTIDFKQTSPPTKKSTETSSATDSTTNTSSPSYSTSLSTDQSVSVTTFSTSTSTNAGAHTSAVTDKETKKPHVSTKKPGNNHAGKNEKQTESKYQNVSTIVGAAVGGLFGVLVVVSIIYFVCNNLKHKSEAKVNKTYSNGHDNGGYKGQNELATTENGHLVPNGKLTNGNTVHLSNGNSKTDRQTTLNANMHMLVSNSLHSPLKNGSLVKESIGSFDHDNDPIEKQTKL